jgi:hypothetical protein
MNIFIRFQSTKRIPHSVKAGYKFGLRAVASSAQKSHASVGDERVELG